MIRSSATTEAAQVRTTYIVGSREDIRHSDYHLAALAAKSERASASRAELAIAAERLKDCEQKREG